MQQTNGPHALRVAGRYAKDTYSCLIAWFKGPTAEEQGAWLRQRRPWAISCIKEEVPKILAELRARYGKEAGRE